MNVSTTNCRSEAIKGPLRAYKVEKGPDGILIGLENCVQLPDKATTIIASGSEKKAIQLRGGKIIGSKADKVSVDFLKGEWALVKSPTPYDHFSIGPGGGLNLSDFSAEK